MRVTVIGDCLLDVTVAPHGPMHAGADVTGGVRLGTGGQAANVAVRLARRGLEVSLVTPLADDAAGSLLRAALAADGVELVALPATRTGAVLALLEPDGERSMVSDRAPFPATWWDPLAGALEGTGMVVCSGYALLDNEGPVLAGRLGRRPASLRLVVAGCSIPPGGATRFNDRVRVARAELLVLNRDEAAHLLGEADLSLAELANRLAVALTAGVVITTARQGSAAAVGSTHVVLPPLSGPLPTAVDTTGAGDAYAAGLVVELTGSAWPLRAAELRRAMAAGAELGARVAGVLGAQGRVDGEAAPGRLTP